MWRRAWLEALGWFPDIVLMTAYLGMSLFRLFMLFWIIVDVIDRDSGYGWIAGVFCCGFVGVLLYMILGRGD
ncbi:MAG: hypothetical protein ACE5O2_03175 [Armatimonadota bacterium]